MSVFSRQFASFLLTACLCATGLVSTSLAQKGGIRKPTKKQGKQEQPVPPLPAYTPAPLQPLPLDQVPAVAPRVQYSGGELTIVAHNSTLSDVLKAVRQQTGADLDIPPNASERVVADLGPGPARDVIAALLNGTHFNYVMVGSATDPTAVHTIVLTAKTGTADTATTAAASRPGSPQRGLPGAAAVVPPPSADATPGADNDGSDDADAADEQAEQTDQQNQQNPAQQTPKTPEQLLQELQRQQQQQQQNPQSGQPPQGVLPNQPPTAAPPNPNKPD
jgi:hypothetical protein